MYQKESPPKKKPIKRILMLLIAVCLSPFIMAFGWLAGIIWLIFFRKRTNPEKRKKYTILALTVSALSLLISIYTAINAPPSPTSLTLSFPSDIQELEINSDYDISVAYEPEDASLSLVTYKVDEPSLADITVDTDNPSLLTLHTKEEGIIDVTASEGSTESNTLSFKIIDSARIEQERKLKEAENSTKATEAEKEVKSQTTSQNKVDKSTPEIKQDEKDPLGFNVMFSKTYKNDTTGNWRLARIAEKMSAEKYALDYYNNYFKSDDEIHVIINFTLNTTTRIAITGDFLDVSTTEYVEKEEHDAAIACSGLLLSKYRIGINNGKIEEIEPQNTEGAPNEVSQTHPVETPVPKAGIEEQPSVTPPMPDAETPASPPTEAIPSNNTGSPENNFNTYNNEEQQQTADNYVLNTRSHKIHYPHCSSVPKIAPQNYATSSLSLAELQAQDYTTCGICFK